MTCRRSRGYTYDELFRGAIGGSPDSQPDPSRSKPMPPDFLLRCTGCGREAVWDTEAIPPVGAPKIGHPVLWRCETCGGEQRHIVAELCIIHEKLHHEICLTTEIDRCTVDRVMAELCRYRKDTCEAGIEKRSRAADEVEDVAGATGVAQELVLEIADAEAAWMRRRGYGSEQPRSAC